MPFIMDLDLLSRPHGYRMPNVLNSFPLNVENRSKLFNGLAFARPIDLEPFFLFQGHEYKYNVKKKTTTTTKNNV